MADKDNLLVSFSGGRTSAYMTWRILRDHSNDYNIAVVFSNTGKEREETLKFVDRCDKELGFNVIWVESLVHYNCRKSSTHKIVSFETAARNGQPFEDIIKKYGIPNQSFPHCTRELKTNPIHSYIKNDLKWADYKTAIGIRADEIDRINPDNVKNKNYWYPLADWGITRLFVEEFWGSDNTSFDLELLPHQGNCDFCWKKVLSKLIKIYEENPSVINWWQDMEDKYGTFIPPTRNPLKVEPPFVFGRQNKSIKEIIRLAKTKISISQIDISEFGCSESCEPFN
jgi:hypothetical protein